MKKSILISGVLAIFVLFIFSCNSKPSKTIENLKASYAYESNAAAEFSSYAQKAKEEGFDTVAVLFEAAAKSEEIHVAHLAEVLKGLGVEPEAVDPKFTVKSTKQNLTEALEDNGKETSTSHPEFIKTAQSEKCSAADTAFAWCLHSENKLMQYYKKALAAVENNDESKLNYAYAVCPKCGNVYDDTDIKETCDQCQTSKEKFMTFMK